MCTEGSAFSTSVLQEAVRLRCEVMSRDDSVQYILYLMSTTMTRRLRKYGNVSG
jgi:hypothetical protein